MKLSPFEHSVKNCLYTSGMVLFNCFSRSATSFSVTHGYMVLSHARLAMWGALPISNAPFLNNPLPNGSISSISFAILHNIRGDHLCASARISSTSFVVFLCSCSLYFYGFIVHSSCRELPRQGGGEKQAGRCQTSRVVFEKTRNFGMLVRLPIVLKFEYSIPSAAQRHIMTTSPNRNHVAECRYRQSVANSLVADFKFVIARDEINNPFPDRPKSHCRLFRPYNEYHQLWCLS